MGRHVLDTLQAAGCEPVVTVGAQPFADVPAIADRWADVGPLGGVASVLLDGPKVDATVVMATDLLGVDVATIRALVDALGDSDADVAVAIDVDGRLHPLCAAWRPRVAVYLGRAVEAGLRAVHGALGQLELATVEVPQSVLRNINTPDDLTGFTFGERPISAD